MTAYLPGRDKFSQTYHDGDVAAPNDCHSSIRPTGLTGFSVVKGNAYLITNQRLVGRTNGSSAYVMNVMSYLKSLGYAVHYVSPSPSTLGRWAIARLQPDIRLFNSYRLRCTVRFRRLLFSTRPSVYFWAILAVVSRYARRFGISLPSGRVAPYSITVPLDDADRTYLGNVVCVPGDLIVLDYAYLTATIEHLGGARVPTLLIMHDLLSSRDAQFAGIGRVDAISAMSVGEELAMLRKADLIIAIQRDEAAFVAQHLPDTPVVVVPMAVEVADGIYLGDDPSILFVGSMAPPNVDGLLWFVQSVWPKIRSRRPDAQLRVLGSVCHHVGKMPEGISLHGVVRDLAPYYRSASVVISPLRVGSGLKIKLVEAMGWGKAIVATSATLQGVEDLVVGAVIRRDDAEGFAASVCTLMNDAQHRAELAQRAQQIARDHFGMEACHSPIREFILSKQAYPT